MPTTDPAERGHIHPGERPDDRCPCCRTCVVEVDGRARFHHTSWCHWAPTTRQEMTR